MTGDSLRELTDFGVSLWLDDLDRGRLIGGGLQSMVDDQCIRGVTTNPTIFHKAISSGSVYAQDISRLRSRGLSAEDIVWELTLSDVRDACDVLTATWEDTGGEDGRVSLEVDPRLAHDTSGTIEQAHELWGRLDRPNAFIKIPATPAGIPAITACIASGISVNVTLIFSEQSYRSVIDAYLLGLEQALDAGRSLEAIASVASFFVSRVDTAVDAHLAQVPEPTAEALLGTAAIANARLAWGAHLEALASDRWRALAAAGARPQRPLWASTGVKNPAYDPTRYVIDLAVPGSVNTMPEGTLHAVARQGVFQGDAVTPKIDQAAATIAAITALGVPVDALLDELQVSGVAAFQESWEQLLAAV